MNEKSECKALIELTFEYLLNGGLKYREGGRGQRDPSTWLRSIV